MKRVPGEKILSLSPRSVTELEHSVRARLEGLSPKLGFRTPTFCLADCPGADERREVAEALIGRALRENLEFAAGADVPFDVEWLPSGEPHLLATPMSGLHISLADGPGFLLCSIGEEAQRCELASLSAARPAKAPVNELQRRLEALDGSAERAQARITATLSALQAIGAGPGACALELAGHLGDAILLRARTPAGSIGLLTLPVQLPNGTQRLLLTVVSEGASRSRQPAGSMAA